jgi:hypothetical protein
MRSRHKPRAPTDLKRESTTSPAEMTSPAEIARHISEHWTEADVDDFDASIKRDFPDAPGWAVERAATILEVGESYVDAIGDAVTDAILRYAEAESSEGRKEIPINEIVEALVAITALFLAPSPGVATKAALRRTCRQIGEKIFEVTRKMQRGPEALAVSTEILGQMQGGRRQ